ncbi:MAG: hypothetical protein RL154_838 [Pseudomonadota bacterium]|jgi:DNA-binding MarR family transcriptional regulator
MFPKLDSFAGFVINKTALAMKNEFEKNLKETDITAVQFGILKRLWECDGLNQKELADRTFKTTAEIKHLIDKLEKKGFVTREVNFKDKREYKIKLTQKGLEIQHATMPIVYTTLNKSLNGITEDEVALLMNICNRIFKNLE